MFCDNAINIRASAWEKGHSHKCGQRMFRSACAFAQSDQDPHCPLADSLDTVECIDKGSDQIVRITEAYPGLRCSLVTIVPFTYFADYFNRADRRRHSVMLQL